MHCLVTFSILLGVGMWPQLLSASETAPTPPIQGDEYANFDYSRPNNNGKGWVRTMTVTNPSCRAEVKGNVTIEFTAPGMTQAKAQCWQQPTKEDANPWGHDVSLADLKLDDTGKGAFAFPANDFPNGPTIVRIYAHNSVTKKRDFFELQLYNQGGVIWKQGIPKTDPPAASGMKLIFADDFDKPLSISRDGQGATYCSHKPPNGDFSVWPFSDFESDLNPFSQVGTFLRIHAAKRADGKTSTGLISSARMDGTGIVASAPFYCECRFLAQSAPGTWPAFWMLNQGMIKKGLKCDELDVIEAYGGLGDGTPNNDCYAICTHFWGQKSPEDKAPTSGYPHPLTFSSKAYWSTTFHIYGVKVTQTDTIYYCDDTEVLRHKSGTISKSDPFFFLINLSIGGAWPVDLARYGDATDMWVDYVRFYQGEPQKP